MKTTYRGEESVAYSEENISSLIVCSYAYGSSQKSKNKYHLSCHGYIYQKHILIFIYDVMAERKYIVESGICVK